PGREEPTGELQSPKISREQLRITFDADENRFRIDNVGRCPLLLNGRPTSTCPWVPGALIELRDQLVLRCERRPALVGPDPGTRPEPFPFGGPDAAGIVGETPEAWDVRHQIAFCGPLDAHVLLRGPSGSGKELVARALHARSRRARVALVSRNAATFPDSLIDAELFGHAANYPNPGMPARPGLIGASDGSTLFLDEFGELPENHQARLLRVLDQGEYTRLGDARSTRADLRLIAATNRPLDVLKPDVLARLPLRIVLPGLDARRADVPLIATHLLRGIARDEPHLAPYLDDAGVPRWTSRLVSLLVDHPYTTHVRELEALLWESMRRGARDRTLDAWPEYAADLRAEELVAPRADPKTIGPDEIRAALDRHGGRQEAAWRELGLSSRHALGRLIRKYGLS
ncbi:MAG: sigma 54-interacting transcriptional regulator, partial [Myxococcota bacterium]